MIDDQKTLRLQNSKDKNSKQKIDSINQAQQQYLNRQSKGAARETYNNAISKIPGLYNESCKVDVEPLEESMVDKYDFFNLTTQMRSNYLHSQFEVVEDVLKTQLKAEQFEEFGLPVQDCIRVCGRIVNLSTEDAVLKEDSIGLFSLGDGDNTTNVYRLKLNCSEVPTYSLFEGEVVVAEGFNDSNSRFNVNRIFKPDVIPPK